MFSRWMHADSGVFQGISGHFASLQFFAVAASLLPLWGTQLGCSGGSKPSSLGTGAKESDAEKGVREVEHGASSAQVGANTRAQTEAIDTTLIPQLLDSHPQYFESIVKDAAELRVQILLGRITRDETGTPRLVRSGFRVDAEYFYPASSIKLLAAVAALEHLNEQSRVHKNALLGADTPMTIAPLFEGDVAQSKDASNLDGGNITAAHEIRKLFLVSDNPAFNRLMDVCGHEELNTRMHRAGLASTVINHRLSDSRAVPRQQDTASITYHTPIGDVIQGAQQSTLTLRNTSARTQVGAGYLSKNERVDTPMEFAGRNGISLVDLQNALVMTVRPDIELGLPGFSLSETDRLRLVDAMGQWPRESANPVYTGPEYDDHAYKLFLPGLERALDDVGRVGGEGQRRVSTQTRGDVRIYNKLGQAYGFTVENAYVVPRDSRLEAFFLTAVIYTNKDGILNDNVYEYAGVAEPFMEHLAEVVGQALWK